MENDYKVTECYTVSWNDKHGEDFAGDFDGDFDEGFDGDIYASGTADEEKLFPQIGSYVVGILEKNGYSIDSDEVDGDENLIANEIAIDTLQDYWYDLAIRRYGYHYAVSAVVAKENSNGDKVWTVRGSLYMDENDSGVDYELEFDHAPGRLEIHERICEKKGILSDEELDKLIIERCAGDYRVKKIDN